MSPPPNQPSPPELLYAAVLFADKTSAVGVLERITVVRRLSGAGFEATVGRIEDKLVVAAVPQHAPPDFYRMINAMRAAYHPEVVVGAGFSEAAADKSKLGSKILADRVNGPDGAGMLMSCGGVSQEEILIGAVSDHHRPQDASDALVTNDWSFPFAEACSQLAQSAAVVTVVDRDPAELLQPEMENVLRQKTNAGRAGAALRMAWSRPSSVFDLLRRRTRVWNYQEELADALCLVLRELP